MIQNDGVKEEMQACSALKTVVIGPVVWETLGAAKPTKEDKIRRKAQKAQRPLDKERGTGIRRNHDGIGTDRHGKPKEVIVGVPVTQLPSSCSVIQLSHH
jgi:hypothetical protein